ncbi:MAG: energy transducer TonB [Methylomonas sp.]|jgi:hypothetical protein
MEFITGCGPSRDKIEHIEQYRAQAKNLVQPHLHENNPEFIKINKFVAEAELTNKKIIYPHSIYLKKPKYPRIKATAYEEAKVICEMIIGKNGMARNVQCSAYVNLTADDSFIKAAEESLTNSVFSPGSIDGEFTDFVVKQPIYFQIPDNFFK